MTDFWLTTLTGIAWILSAALIVAAGCTLIAWLNRPKPEPLCSVCGLPQCTSMDCMAVMQRQLNRSYSAWRQASGMQDERDLIFGRPGEVIQVDGDPREWVPPLDPFWPAGEPDWNWPLRG